MRRCNPLLNYWYSSVFTSCFFLFICTQQHCGLSNLSSKLRYFSLLLLYAPGLYARHKPQTLIVCVCVFCCFCYLVIFSFDFVFATSIALFRSCVCCFYYYFVFCSNFFSCVYSRFLIRSTWTFYVGQCQFICVDLASHLKKINNNNQKQKICHQCAISFILFHSFRCRFVLFPSVVIWFLTKCVCVCVFGCPR